MSIHRRGFTLIELLVVIVILGILSALTLVAVSKSMTTAQIQTTRTLCATLEKAVHDYYVRWGDYPPTRLSELGATSDNGINTGGEAMTACLTSRMGGSILYSRETVNTDGDRATRNLTAWYFEDLELREIPDAFGNPFAYIHFKDYGRPPGNVFRYVGGDVRPMREPAAFIGPDTFQIVSAGPDGKFGTADDVVK